MSQARKQGSLEVIVGCMSSGKSEELIRRIRRAWIAKQQTIVFKPKHDVRVGDEIASRDGSREHAVTIDHAAEALRWTAPFHTVVGFDEAHFFDPMIVTVAKQLVLDGKRVIVAGLDTDYLGNPFGPVPNLMAVADDVTKLKAVCMCCGAPAIRSQLLTAPPSANPIDAGFVGGDDKYEARCRDCHEVPQQT